MRATLILIATLSAFSTMASARPLAPVDYRLTPEIQDGKLVALDVQIGLKADATGKTVIVLPDRNMGHGERWRFISDIMVDGAAVGQDGPAKRILTSPAQAPLTIRYRVRSAYKQDPTGDDGNPYAGAIVLPTWFATLGEFVFAAPEGRDRAAATFHWGTAPKGWVMASNLDAPGQPLTVEDIQNSTMLGGADVEVYSRPIVGGQLRVATRGTWSFADTALADDIAQVISAQRRFWADTAKSYFVSAIPLKSSPNFLSVGGTGRFAGFALYGTGDAEEARLRRILAHEHIHNWIPLRQGSLPERAQEPSAYWYSEGFTDFYTDRTLLRSAIWTPRDFVEHLNEVLRSYGASPVREASAERIVSDFWTNEAIHDLPYQRGYLLAFIWDAQMRRATHGAATLDQVMFAMRDRYVKAPDGDKPDAVESFEAAARTMTGIDVRPDVETYAAKGAMIRLPTDIFGRCGAVSTITIPVVDPGFDRTATAAKGAFVGVDPNGAAYKAGLRDGMKRISRQGGDPTDSRVEVVYGVRDPSGAEHTIRYRPEGKMTVTFQEFVLSPEALAQPALCKAPLAGG
jgi:predicted metalloprotease with PDZ domain